MKTKEKGTAGSLIELVVIVVTALALALGIQAFLVKPYKIPSESMVPTLDVGQRVLVNRIGTHFGDPSVGDIVVFHPPKGADDPSPVCGNPGQGEDQSSNLKPQPCGTPTKQRSGSTFIKRVVGVGGDRIAIRGGHAYRNGVREKDGYIAPCSPGDDCTFQKSIVVPKGYFFMMGDNRGASDDSRFWGPIPKKWVIGSAFATYWPPKRIGVF